MSERDKEATDEYGRRIYLERDLSDWRANENPDANPPDSQLAPWHLRIAESDYGGVRLSLQAPDGTRRSIDVEIDQDCASIVLSGDGPKPLATVRLGAQGLSLTPFDGGPDDRFVVVAPPTDEDDMDIDTPAGPKP